MDVINAFFSVNTIAFTILGYSISWLELVGTIFNLVCVILAARRNIWNWPIGLIGVMLFGVLFYQINLYADVFEQVYYLITGISGWYLWARVGTNKNTDEKVLITTNSLRSNLYWVAGIAGASLLTGWIVSNLHIWLPTLFPEPASLPLLDAASTMTCGSLSTSWRLACTGTKACPSSPCSTPHSSSTRSTAGIPGGTTPQLAQM